jgi:hypothetical protein
MLDDGGEIIRTIGLTPTGSGHYQLHEKVTTTAEWTEFRAELNNGRDRLDFEIAGRQTFNFIRTPVFAEDMRPTITPILTRMQIDFIPPKD